MFELQQGIESPRTGDLQWTVHSVHDSQRAALEEVPAKGCWRIVRCEVIWLNKAAEEYS